MLRALNHPGRLIPVAFAIVLAIGTALLCLPVARTNPQEPANVLAAAFTAVSATCITGLAVVDTATYWTPFGQAVIMAMIQLGGFGIMTLATLVAMLISGRLGLQQSLVAKAESHALTLGDVRGIVKTVGITMVGLELAVALVLTTRFVVGYDYTLGRAAWNGSFLAVSAFNNAGFALYSDNLMSFSQDPQLLLPICVSSTSCGGAGAPPACGRSTPG